MNFFVSWRPYQTIELAGLLYKEGLISKDFYILFLLSYLK